MRHSDEKVVAVTGGAGYVGSRCAVALALRGYKVIVIDRPAAVLAHPFENPRIVVRSGDLRDAQFAASAIEGAELVLHLAARIGSLTYMREFQADILRDNALIDAALYQAAATGAKPCVVYASSSMVFQHAPVFPYKEEDLLHTPPPTNVYGFSKLSGEYFCRAFGAQYGMPYAIIRYHNIYGPGEQGKGAGAGNIHVLPALIGKVLSGQYPLELLSVGGTRPFTYIDDAVEATCMVVNRALAGDAQVLGNDFNIGPSEATSIMDLAEMIWEQCGDGRPFRYVVHNDLGHITAVRREMNAEKIEHIIGWKPKIDLREGIRKTAEWMREQKRQLE
ncbi:MAG: NAD(P)-dependent oxidoreductase [Candidatus Sungiibacteriota bacterium]